MYNECIMYNDITQYLLNNLKFFYKTLLFSMFNEIGNHIEFFKYCILKIWSYRILSIIDIVNIWFFFL